jgi:hypothetical protein
MMNGVKERKRTMEAEGMNEKSKRTTKEKG